MAGSATARGRGGARSRPSAPRGQQSPPPDAAARPQRRRGDDPLLGLGAGLGAICLGQATTYANGMLHPDAMGLLALAALLPLAGLVLPRLPALQAAAARLLPLVLCGGAVWHAATYAMTRPLRHILLGPGDAVWPYYAGIPLLVALVACGVGGSTRLGWRPLLCLLGATLAVLGAWVLRADPQPDIDTFVFHHDAIAALGRGENPYAITYPNIYAPDESNYGPGMVQHGRLQFGYIYPPVSLLLAGIGQLCGDYRLALVASLVAVAALIVVQAPQRLWAVGVAACFALTPRALFALEQGWTEPMVLALLLGALWALRAAPRAAPLLLGAWLTSKQYVPLFAAAAGLAIWPRVAPRARPRLLGGVAVAAAALTLPFVLWSPTAFFNSVVRTHLDFPFREDALNFMGWWHSQHGSHPSFAIGFGLGFALLGLGLVLAPATAAGAVFTFALALFGFVLFNRQAFLNYYHLIMGCMMAVTAWCAPPQPSSARPPPP